MERIEEEENDREKKKVSAADSELGPPNRRPFGASSGDGGDDDDNNDEDALKNDNTTHWNGNVAKATSSQDDEISFNYRLDGDADNALVANNNNAPPYWSLENDTANKNGMMSVDDDDPIRALEQPLLMNDDAEDSSSSLLPYPFTFFEPPPQEPHDSLSSHWIPHGWYRTMWRRPAHEWTWIQAWRMPQHEYADTPSQYDNEDAPTFCGVSRNRRVAIGWVMVVLMAIWITHVYDIHFFRHHSHRNDNHDDDGATLTRGEWIQSCATQLSNATLTSSSSSLPDGGIRKDVLDWFLVGPGREFEPISRNMTTPATAATCDSLTRDSPAVPFASLYALLVLQADLNISLWEKESHPNSNLPMTQPGNDHENAKQTSLIQSVHDVCTKWHRVKCSSKKHEITGLYLSEMEGLAGQIPRELHGLQALERLELYGNPQLVGTIPWEVLGQLTDLQHVYFHQTSLSGTIPPNNESSLTALTNLEQLFLEQTQLEGTMPHALCQLRTVGSLVDLHADCGGFTSRIHCEHPTCCTVCNIHRIHQEEYH